MLQDGNVTLVIDVRRVPRSRTNPQYNEDTLPASLAPYGIGYRRIATLGGLRSKNRTVARDVNAFWENESFHNYADYAMDETFHAGLAQLLELGHDQRCAIMCAEAVWWRCHRRIIADYLMAASEEVIHLMRPGHVEPARMTSAAIPAGPGVLAYPATEPNTPA
ncbi:DUF488 domain-containing protein [Dyella mobilis]|uniref:DUF488 domain-containing protein n=2 Tax=Dyella mobilis TaxID=1849582 RepID=A0ABS2KK13_9GAMM|nr:DUF488 domain-containing protein [Dyella mobilis]